jgi:hypothetical protein
MLQSSIFCCRGVSCYTEVLLLQSIIFYYKVLFSVTEECFLLQRRIFCYRGVLSVTEEYILLQRSIFGYKGDSSLAEEYLLLESIFCYREVSSVT